MGGGTPRANAPIALRPDRLAPIACTASFPSFLRPSVIPGPSVILASLLRHSCAGRNPGAPRQASRRAHHSPNTPPSPNSSLPPSRGEVRWGVERREPARQSRCAPIAWHRSPALLLFRRSCVSSSSFLRRQEPRRPPAPRHSGGPTTHPTSSPPSPIHPSPLPGGRLGGGWNAASQRTNRAAPRSPGPDRPHCSFSVVLAPPSVIPA